MKPLVSVVMAVYNGQRYVKETIESLLNQRYPNIEIIIVDDCSADDTWNILNSFRDDRIILMRNEKNMRLAYSLNRAIAAARGTYIARMDADDICLPKRFELQVAYLERHSEVDVLGGNYRAFGATNKRSDYRRGHAWIKTGLVLENTMCHPAIMFRKEAIGEWYDPSFAASQDYDLWTRLIDKHRFHNLGRELIKYRVHDGQTVKTLSSLQKSGADRARMRMLEKFSFTQEEKQRLIAFVNCEKVDSVRRFSQECRLIASGGRKSAEIDRIAYAFYAARCIWNNVLRQKQSEKYMCFVLYALAHHGLYLLIRPRTLYYVLKGMVER